MTIMKTVKIGWKVNTPALLTEVLANQGSGILETPLKIFKLLLNAVADRALELNDPQLHALMCRLALYEQADPYSAEYDAEMTNFAIKEGVKNQQKMTEKEARQKLHDLWDMGAVNNHFTTGHSGYEMAVKRLMEVGYLDVEFIHKCYSNYI